MIDRAFRSMVTMSPSRIIASGPPCEGQGQKAVEDRGKAVGKGSGKSREGHGKAVKQGSETGRDKAVAGQGKAVKQAVAGHGKAVKQAVAGHGKAVKQAVAGHGKAVADRPALPPGRGARS